jgi:hypothetical protein
MPSERVQPVEWVTKDRLTDSLAPVAYVSTYHCTPHALRPACPSPSPCFHSHWLEGANRDSARCCRYPPPPLSSQLRSAATVSTGHIGSRERRRIPLRAGGEGEWPRSADGPHSVTSCGAVRRDGVRKLKKGLSRWVPESLAATLLTSSSGTNLSPWMESWMAALAWP